MDTSSLVMSQVCIVSFPVINKSTGHATQSRVLPPSQYQSARGNIYCCECACVRVRAYAHSRKEPSLRWNRNSDTSETTLANFKSYKPRWTTDFDNTWLNHGANIFGEFGFRWKFLKQIIIKVKDCILYS